MFSGEMGGCRAMAGSAQKNKNNLVILNILN